MGVAVYWYICSLVCGLLD